MTTAIVALLVLLPVAVMSRVQTQFRCAFVRKWLALPAHSRDSMAPYTVCTAVFAALITLFYVFQVCSSVGAENGVDVMQSKAWNIRKDMRAFLNSMNCIQELWKQLVGQFGILKSEGRRDAVEQVNKIQKTADKVQDNVHRKITAAKDVLITHEITYPGFVGIKTSPFQAGRRRLDQRIRTRFRNVWNFLTLRLLTFVTSLLVVVFVLCLVVTFALGVSMRSPDTMPVERGKFSNFAGLAILFTAYGALPASAVLLLIGRNIMNLSVAAQAFICTPYSRRSPSLVDHDIGQVRKKLLGSSDSAAYRHNDTDLKALMQYVLDFKAYLDDEKLRVNIGRSSLVAHAVQVIAALGHCDELKQAYDSGVSILCNVVLSNTVSRLILHGATSESCDGSRMEQPPLHCLGIALNLLSPCMCSQPFSKTVIVQRRPGRQQPSGNLHEAAPERIVPEVTKAKYEQPPSKCSQRDSSSQNGFWVALVVTALLVACASFTSLRLSRQCLKITRMAEPDALSDKDHRSKANVGREACGDFRSSPSPDDDLNVTVLGGSVEGDHAFRA
ncbi:hypothetical protein V5799_006757 [Amblyomma americanum]|uniref:Uncharacterized protein n=1 Tax=Amblyomma americanum TaxID=6943 RepID=A0AAQ4DVH4_AMBAM